jgi:hypothetical protein
MNKKMVYGSFAILAIAFIILASTQVVTAAPIKTSEMVIGRGTCQKEVGEVNVIEGGGKFSDYLFVEYVLDDDSDWEIVKTKLAVEEDFDDIPTNCYGRPIVRNFEYDKDSDEFWDDADSENYADAPSETKIVYKIPYVVEGDHDWEEDDTLYIAAYSLLKKTVTINWCGYSWERTIYRSCWANTGYKFTTCGNALYFTATIEGEHL